jgi:hypothetical protein
MRKEGCKNNGKESLERPLRSTSRLFYIENSGKLLWGAKKNKKEKQAYKLRPAVSFSESHLQI